MDDVSRDKLIDEAMKHVNKTHEVTKQPFAPRSK